MLLKTANLRASLGYALHETVILSKAKDLRILLRAAMPITQSTEVPRRTHDHSGTQTSDLST